MSWKWEIPMKWCTTQHHFQYPAPPLKLCVHFHLHFHIYHIYHQSCGKLRSRETVWHGPLIGRSISKWSFPDHGEKPWEHSIATHRSVTAVGASALVTVEKQSARGLKRKTNQEERRKTTKSDCVVTWGQFFSMSLNIYTRILEMSKEGLG